MTLINAGTKFQAWQTPRHIFQGLERYVGAKFDLDAFAAPENALCERFLTKEDDSVMCKWQAKATFANPPYGGNMQAEAVAKAIREVRMAETTPLVVLLIQAAVSTRWFLLAAQTCEVKLYHGRIAFDAPASVKRSASTFSNAAIIVRPAGVGPVGITGFLSAKTGNPL